MRLFLKNNILEIINTIYEAHENIGKLLQKNDPENAKNILAECQDTAVQIGNIIEESEGQGAPTISFLEEYCEGLYEVATSLLNKVDSFKIRKNLDKLLLKAHNSIKNDVEAKLEIAFMPYKASMWDAFDSVYKCAMEDPSCNVSVVPIPYYDKTADGRLGQIHYEGDKLPQYVKALSYESYDLGAINPDIIYIHSPYDGYNRVTSVAPRFYSSELKKYTNMLVYIPYYVVAHEKINEAMLNVPACLFADRVILQSKALCKKYIDIYTSQLKEYAHIFREKFVALGSPKFDAVKNARREDFSVSDDWAKLINGKKVVLYNTSIGISLNYTDKFLEKLEKNIEYFKNSEEYVLWWRPHPLLETTFASMKPEYLQRYRQIVDRYRSADFGIYDDTTDFLRAMTLSDIYYGDLSSSVATLYFASGKEVIHAYIGDEGCGTFIDDRVTHNAMNKIADLMMHNENFDGTAGAHIHSYIKKEVLS